ncbi:hypothetical protein HDU88_001787, partial [Geranomyces variabilis]
TQSGALSRQQENKPNTSEEQQLLTNAQIHVISTENLVDDELIKSIQKAQNKDSQVIQLRKKLNKPQGNKNVETNLHRYTEEEGVLLYNGRIIVPDQAN